MENNKPRLSLDEQIQHLKDKGILFNIMDEDSAKQYLKYNNNYYKLTSFRKNYDKHPGGENEGKYMRLRYRVVEMALDIEHHTKLQLLRKMDEYDEDGYQIVKDYIDSLDEKYRNYLFNELNRNRGNAYCGDMIEKYDGNYPVWVFLEIIPFGRMVAFYCFCANRFSDKEMKNNFEYPQTTG